MIIGENFIWQHFPKCAGTFTENLLRKYFQNDPTISFDPIDPSNIIWHQNVRQREKRLRTDLSRKEIISNFRRLPYWMISRIKYEAIRSGQIVQREMYVEGKFFEMNGDELFADKYIQRFTERKISHWIRVEYLEEDFYKAFSNYLDVRNIVKPTDFNEKINATKGVLNQDEWFNEDEIGRLYAANPEWADIERELYGSLLAGPL
jgi:hypothetical protein